MITIETASVKEIAEYLDYLYNTTCNKDIIKYGNGLEIYHSNIWEKLYNKVFSDEISKAICKRFPDFDWYDPDTSYYRDVIAFIDAFKDYAKNNNDENVELFPNINEYFENKNIN